MSQSILAIDDQPEIHQLIDVRLSRFITSVPPSRQRQMLTPALS